MLSSDLCLVELTNIQPTAIHQRLSPELTSGNSTRRRSQLTSNQNPVPYNKNSNPTLKHHPISPLTNLKHTTKLPFRNRRCRRRMAIYQKIRLHPLPRNAYLLFQLLGHYQKRLWPSPTRRVPRNPRCIGSSQSNRWLIPRYQFGILDTSFTPREY